MNTLTQVVAATSAPPTGFAPPTAAPHVLPMNRDVRTWELEDTVKGYAADHPDLFAGSVVFKPQFRVPGIDTLHIKEYTGARDRILALATQPEARGKGMVVGTVSSCHGAVGQAETLADDGRQ